MAEGLTQVQQNFAQKISEHDFELRDEIQRREIAMQQKIATATE